MKRRKVLYELILSDHPKDYLHCGRNKGELQSLGEVIQAEKPGSPAALRRNPDDQPLDCPRRRYILCRRCVTVCNGYRAWASSMREPRICHRDRPGNELPLASASCAYCGRAPRSARSTLHERTRLGRCFALAIRKTVVVLTAPAVRRLSEGQPRQDARHRQDGVGAARSRVPLCIRQLHSRPDDPGGGTSSSAVWSERSMKRAL